MWCVPEGKTKMQVQKWALAHSLENLRMSSTKLEFKMKKKLRYHLSHFCSQGKDQEGSRQQPLIPGYLSRSRCFQHQGPHL